MEYILLSSSRLKVVLSCEDLARMPISPPGDEHSGDYTWQTLIYLLEMGKLKTGFSPAKSKIYTEMYPNEDSGMVVYFTSIHRGLQEPVIFAFDDARSLAMGCVKVFERHSHRIQKSSLYSFKDGWRLAVYALDYEDNLSIAFLCEFGRISGVGEVLRSFIEEHGKELIVDDALEVMAKYFGG